MIAERLVKLRQAIETAAGKAGGPPDAIQWVLVSKTVPEDRILEAYRAGVRDFGENRVQELLRKKAALPEDIRWHFIGHLQTNKVRQVLGQVVLIHSLDRLDLIREIDRQAKAKKISGVPCLIQVNSSGESSKYGFPPGEVDAAVASLGAASVIQLQGLMTIGPLTEDAAEVRKAFRKVKDLSMDLRSKYPGHAWNILSMGMSQDYPVAIEEGANLLRIGTAVFGERKIHEKH